MFSDQTETTGIDNTYSLSAGIYRYFGGGSAGDFNNDGWQDIFIPGSEDHPDRLYINQKNETFTDKASEWGLTEGHSGSGVAVGDFNSDGWLDIFMTSIGPFGEWGLGYNKLYRNDNGTGFTNVAEAAGVHLTDSSDPDLITLFGTSFGDYDLDGDLDLFVAGRNASFLFRNEGNETFTDVTFDAGVVAQDRQNPDQTIALVHGLSPNFVDMDGDRYPELLYVGDFGYSKYFKNNRDGTFTDVTAESNTGAEEQGMGQTVGDFNGDGLLDWYVTSIFYPPFSLTGNKLYLNKGNHVYEEVGELAGVENGGLGWAAVAVDFNHDGLLDLAETNGNRESESFATEQSYLWINTGGSFFSEQALARGFDHDENGRCMINLDYDNDGDQDVVIFSNGSPVKVLRNDLQGPETNWLRVFLDTRDRPDLAPNGFGSKIITVTRGFRQTRSIHGAETYLGKAELSAHFGLGVEDTVDQLLIEWPSGETTTLSSIPSNQTLTISAPPRHLQKPGDCNQNGNLDVGDAVCLLTFLFVHTDAPLPCGDTGAAYEKANTSLLDTNGDGILDIVDVLRTLFFLVLGEPPHSLGSTCTDIEGCPDNSAACQL